MNLNERAEIVLQFIKNTNSDTLKKFYKKNRTSLLIFFDIFTINAVIIITFLLRFGGFPKHNFIAYKNMFFFIIVIRISCFYYFRLYSRKLKNNLELIYDVFISVFFGTVLILAVTFINRSFAFPRTVTLISFFLNIAVIYFIRILIIKLEKNDETIRRVLIIGYNTDSQRIIKELERKSSDFKLIGFVSSEKYENKYFCGNILNLKKILIDKNIDILIVTGKEVDKSQITNLLFFCENRNIDLKIVPDLYEILIGRSSLESFISYPLVEPTKKSDIDRMNYIKRIIDIFFSTILILLLAPLLIIVGIVIKLDSKGPALFLQRRIGLNGKEFVIFKFRSMVSDAEKDTGPVMAVENDSRVTKIGKWIRKFRIDEFPQLFNVLMGDMSLVGPRPERNNFVEEFSKEVSEYSRRFDVRPGITGLAQIMSDYDLDAKNKLRYDLAYINNWDFFLEFKIMIETIKVIIFKKGAY